jgi:LacI family transcriptional regulator
MKKVTIEDIAREAGVSKGTVSAVINQKSTVNSETREIVLDTMKQMNYRPRGSARNLRRAKREDASIGLLIRELNNPFYTTLALGVMEYATSKGYLVLIASSEGDHMYEDKITDSFSIRDIKGAIIAPVLEGTAEIEHLFELKMVNFPFVLLESVKGIQANVVSINNIKAMKEAMKYLMDNGHSNIVHFAGPKHAFHTYERIDGFRRAYSESQFAYSNDMIIPTGALLEDGYRTCHEYFHNRRREDFPSAIVCYNDLVALGVMTALAELNIKVPEEMSVIGNDDIPFSRQSPIKLTTIQAPIRELGRKAAEILIRNIESPEPLPVENVVLNADLVIRESTKALSSAYVGAMVGEARTASPGS